MFQIRLLLAAALLCFSFSLFATNYTWIGGTGDWNIPANWNPYGVPSDQDHASVSNGHVSVPNSYYASVGSFNVYGSGHLTVQPQAGLTVKYNTAYGFSINAQVTIKGVINCTPDSQTVTNLIGIGDYGSLVIESSGTLNCQDFSAIAIYTTGTLDNSGTIDIDGGFSGENGITDVSGGNFVNRSSGWILINDITGIGIAIVDGSFYNHNYIRINSSELSIGIGLTNADFYNQDYLLIQGGESFGINVGVNCSLENQGFINLIAKSNQTGSGLGVFGSVTNHSNGRLWMQKQKDKSCWVHTLGTLDNQGEFTIFGNGDGIGLHNNNYVSNEGLFRVMVNLPAGSDQILNTGDIENLPCGYFSQTQKLENTSTGSIINEGFWVTTHDGVDSQNGTILNAGAFSSVYNSLDISQIQNYGYFIPQINGAVCINDYYKDAYFVGSNPSCDAGLIYTNDKYNIVAGEYHPTDNYVDLFPDANGLSILYAEFVGPNGCTDRIPIGFDPTIQGGVEICNDGIDNDCDGHIDEAACNAFEYDIPTQELKQKISINPILHPNPSSGDLQITLPKDAGEIRNIRVYNLQGQLVRAMSGLSPNVPFSPGGYFIQVETENEIYPPQRWMVIE
ncbi:MAG: T9SS type A sorting domain-containing protein [Bacteroidetes bacterium]|nr:T9SS type A sorting domain-containing protein [Bacteroidota bacterium]